MELVITQDLIGQHNLTDDVYWEIAEMSGCEPNLMRRLR